ncbi:MAG: HD domain-containing protein [Candidatus Gracilibacteria bacterium]|nr:HD domain-containing protein [Candidatus Gracilibacteria bacterium]
MNQKIIAGVKDYVNVMMGPLESHYYHQFEHALEVSQRCLELGEKEGLSDDELEVLVIAGLFHDVGFIIQYDNNEYIGAKIAKNYLKSILYPNEKIELVEQLIIATIYDREPRNILENIIRDADTDNLGRDDFFDKGERLKTEIESIKKIKILSPDWLHYSIKFLLQHKFFTRFEILERQEKKEENLKELQKRVNN